jgi:pimeloyl-ACP methyl ester carboxylesterase
METHVKRRVSYLHGGEDSPVLLLHDTFRSRVWLPILPKLAEGHAVFAPDYPGFGRSGGRLESEEASAPALADLVLEGAGVFCFGDVEEEWDEIVPTVRTTCS